MLNELEEVWLVILRKIVKIVTTRCHILKTGLNAFFSFWHCKTNYKMAKMATNT